jgi:hypothetical protein
VQCADEGVEVGSVLQRKEDVELNLLRGVGALAKDRFVGSESVCMQQYDADHCRKESKMSLRKSHGKPPRVG